MGVVSDVELLACGLRVGASLDAVRVAGAPDTDALAIAAGGNVVASATVATDASAAPAAVVSLALPEPDGDAVGEEVGGEAGVDPLAAVGADRPDASFASAARVL
jgi:hypothetical protein